MVHSFPLYRPTLLQTFQTLCLKLFGRVHKQKHPKFQNCAKPMYKHLHNERISSTLLHFHSTQQQPLIQTHVINSVCMARGITHDFLCAAMVMLLRIYIKRHYGATSSARELPFS
uniref:Uncharacterized protein n=1 Tax=Corethron hystrix TaxID=216773 RepID=A0A6U5GXU7_9STRA|mmetsp:Transcript_28436/g.65055  ORF Transcript_28436/g.65055 Transcript_28436/m.65055 type:complete len:115 (+) Transcript_28436:158-502(+)